MKKKGLTALELLITLGIIGSVMVMIMLFIRPLEIFDKTRTSARITDMRRIADSILKYQIDHEGELPSAITYDLKMIGKKSQGCDYSCPIHYFVENKNARTQTQWESQKLFTSPQCVDLSQVLQDYLALPSDPLGGSDEQTFYAINKDEKGRIRVYACADPSNPPLHVVY